MKTEKEAAIVRKLAEASVSGLKDADGYLDKRAFRALIRRDFALISEVHREICEDFKNGGCHGAVCEWLTDNYYVIEAEYREFLKGLRAADKICTSGGSPRVHEAVKRFVSYSDFPLYEGACAEIADALCRECSLSLGEYFSMAVFFRSALISVCSVILCEYRSAVRLAQGLREEKYAERLGSIITSMRYVSYHDFGTDLLRSECAAILSLDPSGDFDGMTDATKALYLSKLMQKAKKSKKSETEYARELLERARKAENIRDKHIGCPLFEHPKEAKIAYLGLIFGLSVLITAVLAAVFSPICIAAFFPVWEAVKLCVDYGFSRFTSASALPRMELSGIPYDSSVLVVITSLLLGEQNDGALFDNLERIYRSGGEENVFFGILGDIADSKSANAPGDEAVISHAYGRIEALSAKYADRFILFERRRSYSKSEESFMGWERKRGAVLELVRLLRGKSTTFSERSTAMAHRVLDGRKIKYVITLDADTNLPLGAVRDMCSAMLHPLARPVIDEEKGIVVQGYGIMQPICSPELSAASATPFAGMMCGEGGTEFYSTARFDVYQSIFGEGIFCGKGIFDVDAFETVIDRHCTFPEDMILSHDCLEGAKLRSALISDLELTDGFPRHELSYLKRRHRWVRGDIQNLRFLSGKVVFGNGEIRKNHISGLSKYKLFDNARSAVLPIFSFVCVFASVFVGEKNGLWLLLSSLLYIALPVLLDGLNMSFNLAFDCAARRYFSKGVSAGIFVSLMRALFVLAMLPSLALSSVDAVSRSIYRMFISGKGLLEWQTAAQSDNGDGSLLMFVHKNIFSAFSGFLLFVIAPAGFLRALSLLWLSFPVLAYHTSVDRVRESTDSEQIKKKYRRYARDIWQYFAENVNASENFLPPDNIQLSPREATAHRTSPTNIGLYLVSVLCARDFAFIGTEQMQKRLEDTVSVLESMEKYCGHFYNWYDTENLSVLMPRYISTVDSGNLTACLIVLKEGLREYVCESTSLIELIRRIEALCDATEYSFLYNKKRDLFSLGAEISDSGKAEVNGGCYDLMMSEARTLSYIECARRNVPKKHWSKLSRALVTRNGYIGLSSWTGTAFEYFMPPIFLPVYKRSLFGEAMHFAQMEQQRYRAVSKGNAVFGISESGYFSFDSEMNYRYRAFGVPSLALKPERERELVISPYSTFISLCIGKKAAMKNLETMEKLGYYGKYGFFEAVDFTVGRGSEKGSVVKSFMAHHLGMSMCALCNAAFSDILSKRFMSDSAMRCASELLQEKIPVNCAVRQVKKRHDIPQRPQRNFETDGRIYADIPLTNPSVSSVSDGNGKLIASSSGHVELSDGDYLINHCDFDKYICNNSFFGFVRHGDVAFSCSELPGINPARTEYSMRCSPGSVSLRSRLPGKLEFSMGFTLIRAQGSVFTVKASLKDKTESKDSEAEFAFCFSPVISKKDAYSAHPAFSSLFLESEYAQDDKLLIFRRRPGTENEKERFLGVGLRDKALDFSFSTRLDECFSAIHTPSDFAGIFSSECKNELGACIKPYCKIVTRTKKVSGNAFCELLICCADSKEKVICAINSARERSFEEKAAALTESSSKLASSAGVGFFGSDKAPSAAEKLLSGIVFGSDMGGFFIQNGGYIGKGELWKNGISGDLPIAALSVISSSLIPKLEKYLRSFRLLRLSKIRFDLCIIYSETERYARPKYHEILGLLSECDCNEYLGKSGGGIFLIDRSIDESGATAVSSAAAARLDILFENRERTDKEKFNLRLPVCAPLLSVDFPKKHSPSLSVTGGDFGKDCFVVRKDREFKSPYSHILAGRRLSSLVTHNSLGYTWVLNAQNRRITPHCDNGLSDMDGERLFLVSAKKSYDLCAMARYVTYGAGEAEYVGIADGIEYSVKVYVSAKLGAKYCDVRLKFPSGSSESRKLAYYAVPVMGRFSSETRYVRMRRKSGVMLFENVFSEFFGSCTGFLGAVRSDSEVFGDACFATDRASVFGTDCLSSDCADDFRGTGDCVCAYLKVCESDMCEYYRFILGAVRDSGEKNAALEYTLDSALCGMREYSEAVSFARSLIPGFEIVPKKNSGVLPKAYGALFNFFLPYQNGAARFIGRSGFYQSGGAYGFRDQLQDSLCLMSANPKMTRAHIYRCCGRQFPEGDVLHWWHDMGNKSGRVVCRGIRSLCSDDYLWLPFTAARYCIYSGDTEFFKKRIRFASAPPLSASASEKYVEVCKSDEYDSVYGHCKRSLDRGIQRLGVHGLPLIGSCDWCDGYSNVGNSYDGESVWLGMFLSVVLEEFCAICRKFSDAEALDRYSHARLSLLEAIEKHGWAENEGQYIRAYYADGTKLGSLSSDECKSELLGQCFAPFLGSVAAERLYTALKNAYLRLFDKEYGLFRLFAPAFKDSEQNPGYIKGYVAGIRENGGQYTHAALWGAMGLTAGAVKLYTDGHTDKARELFAYAANAINAQNTALRCIGYISEKARAAYGIEPYWLAGDIYSNKDHYARGGWSLYTGSASWYYRLILEWVYGLRFYGICTENAYFEIECRAPLVLPELCFGSELIMNFGDSEYRIEYRCAERSGITVDSLEAAGRIRIEKGRHRVTVTLPKM